MIRRLFTEQSRQSVPAILSLLVAIALGSSQAAATGFGEGSNMAVQSAVAPNELIKLIVTAPKKVITAGEAIQLTVIGVLADGTRLDVTASTSGTEYFSEFFDSPVSVQVTAGGLVTGLEEGLAAVLVRNRLALGMIYLRIASSPDSDGDGIPNADELALGLDPSNSSDGAQDIDGDGLTNFDELTLGTDPHDPDMDDDGASDAEEIQHGSRVRFPDYDGDGLLDGQELALGTNPNHPDTDGDRLPDGSEVEEGTDPLVPQPPPPPVRPLLNETCTVSTLNRSARVRADGVWVLPNVPSTFGRVRARATCAENGITRSGQSDYFTVPRSGVIQVSDIRFDAPQPVPERLVVAAPQTTLTSAGQQVQLSVTAIYPGGTTVEVASASAGTNYTVSNPRVATISADGVVQAVASGTVIVSAANDGASGFLLLQVALAGDSDGDGLSDDFELANGLDPNNGVDALDDPDEDGLSTSAEFQAGLDPFAPDTDEDGLLDGREVNATGTNPALFDTDGDGLGDGLEIATGSDPVNALSFNLAAALLRIEVAPEAFLLVFDALRGEGSRKLSVVGHLTDGKRIDLIEPRYGTQLSSSDLTICNFGSEPGRVFAGAPGTCTITVSNSGFSATAQARVESFTPTVVGAINLPPFANDVEVNGNTAFVAGGPVGLHVIDVSDRRAPRLLATLPLLGNANDVRVRGSLVFVAGGSAGLHVVNAADPASPRLVASLDTAGEAIDLALAGSFVYVADGPAGLAAVEVDTAGVPILRGTLDTPGSANGIEVTDGIAVVSNFQAATSVVDISNPVAPTLRGSLSVGANTFDVLLIPPFAYLASASNLRVIDLTNPANPVFRGAFGAGLFMTDVIAEPGGLLFTTQIRPDTPMPIFRLTNPAQPLFASSIVFSQFGLGAGDGTGLAADGEYVYLTATRGFEAAYKPGTTGDTRLYIARYSIREDLAGQAPAVTLTAPAPGAAFTEDTSFTATVEANDDVAVAEVELIVDGNVVSTDFERPYEFTVRVPLGQPNLTLTARARDLSNNVSTSTSLVVTILSDPPPTVAITTPADGTTFSENTQITIAADATDNRSVVSVQFRINGRVVSTDSLPPYSFETFVPVGETSLTIEAEARDDLGRTSHDEILVFVESVPGTTAVGSVVDSHGAPAAGATVICTGVIGMTLTDGTFSIPGIPSLLGSIRCRASFRDTQSRDYAGTSQRVIPVPAGVTNMGQIQLQLTGAFLYPAPQLTVDEADGIKIADVNGDDIPDLIAGAHTLGIAVLLGTPNGGYDVVRYFETASSGRFVSGGSPKDVWVGDFNGDTLPDIAAANGGSYGISVLLGHGDGTFQPHIDSAAGTSPVALAAGDFNEDGRLDLAAASGNLSVLLGNGDGTLTLAGSLTASGAVSVEAGDVNQDGHLDLLSAQSQSRDVRIFLGNGTGTFTLSRTVSLGTSSLRDLAVGDLNGDGRPDFAAASGNNVRVFFRLADGTYATGPSLPAGSDPFGLIASDVDADGDLDLAAVNNGTNDISLFLGNGSGSFGSGITVFTGADPNDLTAGDLNRDGIADLVTANTLGLSLVHGLGNAAFDTDSRYPAGEDPLGVTVADFNGDGAQDVAVASNDSDEVAVLLGRGDGTFAAEHRFPAGVEPENVATGDFNEDGKIDLVLGNRLVNTLNVLLGQGDGTFASPSPYPAGSRPSALWTADLNGDGHVDLVAVNFSSNDVSLFLGHGDGTFAPQLRYPVGEGPWAVAVGDFQGDGHPDLVTANYDTGDLSLLSSDGAGGFQPEVRLPLGTDPFPSLQSVAAADLDGDGKEDLVVSYLFDDNLDYFHGVLLGNGNGTFQPLRVTPAGPNAFGLMLVADANGDGIPDIVSTSPGGAATQDLLMVLGQGDGTFGVPQRYVVTCYPYYLATGDFNGDGQVDFVTTNGCGDNNVSILLHH